MWDILSKDGPGGLHRLQDRKASQVLPKKPVPLSVNWETSREQLSVGKGFHVSEVRVSAAASVEKRGTYSGLKV